MASISESSAERIRAITDRYTTAEERQRVPGINIRVINKDGATILSHTSGQITRIENPSETRPLNPDDAVRFYSVGKLFAAVAALQLAERGLLDLDDPKVVEKYLPQFSPERMKVLKRLEPGEPGKRQPVWEERMSPITVRMLLTHTAGVSHTIFDAEHREMLNGGSASNLSPKTPWEIYRAGQDKHFYIDQPGVRFHYSGGMEPIAILVEKITGMSLRNYYDANIVKPAGFKHTRAYNVEESIPEPSKLHTPSMRSPDGSFKPQLMTAGSTFYGLRANDDFKAFPESDKHGYSVSTTIVGTAGDLSLLLAALLNDGVSPVTGERVLSPESIKMMATPQLSPSQIEKHRRVGDPGPVNHSADLGARDPKGSIGISCAVQGEDRMIRTGRGRKAGSFYWYGLANMDWWVDPKAGIAVVATSHFFPWQDPAWVDYVGEVEEAIYDGLEPSKAHL
ncbi:beta-lactamase/transpeptidase-like protein [Rhizodiscina lignyota]|uniref:Beta-lactamase/transpeptidase-like protein n=1 Tax=Rhizodiscina lignyota TaxID=1504668 RepID=A0A9P4IJS2_9PEZI|nr:beta-lactamase/transpeptidase-like protein [Rhizodiscina lignyota]